MRDCLRQGYETLTARMGQAPATSRMGWEFHNDLTMHTLNELGLRVDFSAVPGRYTPGGLVDSTGGMFHGWVDWRGTSDDPYQPAAVDYRRPAKSMEDALNIVELPLSTFRSPLLSMAGKLRHAAKALTLGRFQRFAGLCLESGHRVKAYITMHPAVFSPLIVTKLRQARRCGYALLVTAFHADELLEDSSSLLRTHSGKYFEENLKRLRTVATQHQLRLRFVTPREVSFAGIPALFQRRSEPVPARGSESR